MNAAVLGVQIAHEAARRGLLRPGALRAVLAYYDEAGAHFPAPPAEVLVRVGGVREARALELLRELGHSDGQQRFNDRLTLHSVLGRGGMGVVHKAHDHLLGRLVALKVIDVGQVEAARRPTLLARFRREAQVMARLDHAAVAQLYDAGVDEVGNPWLTMELVPGQSLQEVIDAAGPSELELSRVVGWGATLAEALHACHEAGVLHRDVKPSNVIITPDGEPRLIDFGVAADALATTQLTRNAGLLGTLLYMAPEQAGGGPCDRRVDIYALAGTLFHALTGRPPYQSENMIGLLAAIEGGRPPRLRSLRPNAPRALDHLLRRCLEKSPAARPPDAATMAAELRGSLRRTSWVTRPRGLPRHTAPGAAISLLIMAGMAWGWLQRPPQETVGAPASISSEPPAGTSSPALPAGLEPGPGPGEFVNTKDGSVLMFIPAGEFLMGHPEEGEEGPHSFIQVKWNDRPAHRVSLSGYYIGKYEVTWRQFRRFASENPELDLPADAHTVDVGGVRLQASDDCPVFGLGWAQAEAYCKWAGLRLPTEAEWELAAKGAEPGSLYPWGKDQPAPGHANLYGNLDGYAFVSPVGAFPQDRSPWGCHDMAGNVSEWVFDLFGPYADTPAHGPSGPADSTLTWAGVHGWRKLERGEGPLRVMRGGAWNTWDGRVPQVDFYAPGTYYYQVTRRFAGSGTSKAGNATVGLRVCRNGQ